MIGKTKNKNNFRSVLVPGGFWQQIGVAWCFVDQNSNFKMYFSDQIRQIKLKKKKITEKCSLKKTKKEEEEEEDFQRMTKERKDLRARRGLQQHREGRAERRDERHEGAGFAQSKEMR